MALKCIGKYIAKDVGFRIRRTNGADQAWYDVAITDGNYWVLGDATTGDLLRDPTNGLEAKIKAVGGGTPFANFSLTVDTSTGIVSAVLGSGETGELDWDGHSGGSLDATEVRDNLRYSGDLSLSDVAVDGSRCHRAGFYPVYVAVNDLKFITEFAFQRVSDTGKAWSLSYQTRTDWEITFQTKDSNPYDTVYNEYHALEDLFINHLMKGKGMRYYRDKTVTSAFADVSAPTGYLNLVMRTRNFRFRLQDYLREDGYYDSFIVPAYFLPDLRV